MDVSEEIKCLSTSEEKWIVDNGLTHTFNRIGDKNALEKAIRAINEKSIDITLVALDLIVNSSKFSIGLEGIQINSKGETYDLIPSIKKTEYISKGDIIISITYAINLDSLTEKINMIIENENNDAKPG